ncbi:MAG: hypothetical protein LBD42_04285 [Desulfovibrio sp.]|jgi:hypothetical protein|nr:hypothetical protein [Desulfovibrio sp.]
MKPVHLSMPPPGKEAKVAPEPGRPLALAFAPMDMRFERGGRNLYIDAPDGAQLVIVDYFAFPELPAFYTEDGRLVSGVDFLMVMNPIMDLTIAESFPASAGKSPPIFNVPGEPWDESFYHLATEDNDARYHAEWAGLSGISAAPDAGAAVGGRGGTHYWLGGDALQGQSFIQNIAGSITVTLIAPSGATAESFFIYASMQGGDFSFPGAGEAKGNNGLFQDGVMGRASIVQRSALEGDSLTLAAEAFSSFESYYGGWLLMSFPSMRVEGIEILMNAPSGQSVVDLQEYFSHPVFNDVPIAWLYDEEHKVPSDLADFIDDGFDLFDFLDVVAERETLLPLADDPVAESLLPHVEDIVLVHAESHDAIKLRDDWTLPEKIEDTSYSPFTFDEQTMPLHESNFSENEGEG